MRRFDDSYVIEDRGHSTACWIWTGPMHPDGYGSHGGRQAHRWAFLQVREATAGLVLDHLCGQRECVNVAHLEEVTQGENVRRGRGAKLDMDKAREIRGSSASSIELAAVYGVHPRTIDWVRSGRTWREAAA